MGCVGMFGHAACAPGLAGAADVEADGDAGAGEAATELAGVGVAGAKVGAVVAALEHAPATSATDTRTAAMTGARPLDRVFMLGPPVECHSTNNRRCH